MTVENEKNILLSQYQVRKSRKEKDKFIEYIAQEAKKEGYSIAVEETRSLVNNKNIILGNVENAKYIFTAHYDTCALSLCPLAMWLKNPVMYIVTQAIAVAFLFLVAFAVTLIVSMLFEGINVLWAFELTLVAICTQLMFGFRNPHTANDNTSGVLTLLQLMRRVPKDKRGGVAFVFFDNEEKGLIGSLLFRKAHRESLKNTLLINFDCVGEGNTAVLACNKRVTPESAKELISHFPQNSNYSVADVKGNLFSFSSDQLNFENAVGVCTANKSWLGGYMVGKIHTHKDTVLKEENVEYLTEWIVKLLE